MDKRQTFILDGREWSLIFCDELSVTASSLQRKIGCLNTRVDPPEGLIYGMCIPDMTTILIQKGLSKAETKETLLHELVEAYNSIFDLNINHTIIQTISYFISNNIASSISYNIVSNK